jgi:hypothetical protein
MIQNILFANLVKRDNNSQDYYYHKNVVGNVAYEYLLTMSLGGVMHESYNKKSNQVAMALSFKHWIMCWLRH